jgi:succinate dehydrogenase / fumarate reductase cytochrome b subunit
MPTPQRPLSPHLQIYKPQITTVLSILHRITGLILAFGTFAIAWWLLAVSAATESHFDQFMELIASVPGKILLAAFSWCLLYHLLNGLRHLLWDSGRGFEINQTYATGWAVVVLSFALTAGLWALAMSHGGTP